jgi:hypothetical protein
MIYVFSFLGEFGYELLNWQGTIRKWVTLYKQPEDKIIICSRKGLEQIYEFADTYINISELDSYNNTIGDCYTCYIFTNKGEDKAPKNEWQITRTGPHLDNLKSDIKKLIINKVGTKKIKYIWSSDFIELNGLTFGLERPGGRGGIYNNRANQLNIDNNEYIKIKPSNHRSQVEEKLNFDLDQPYILCQTGWRSHIGISHTDIDYESYLSEFIKSHNIILLNFETGRSHDSYSKFENKYINYQCESFNEQSVLIENANKCIFFTEGDFRTHLYLPPMMGKDVHIIAPQKVWNLHSAPYQYWNKNIFKFGGQIIPHILENKLDLEI